MHFLHFCRAFSMRYHHQFMRFHKTAENLVRSATYVARFLASCEFGMIEYRRQLRQYKASACSYGFVLLGCLHTMQATVA